MEILGTELTVGVLGFLAALVVALFSWRVANLTGKKRYTYFGLAFLLASVSSGVMAWFAYKGINITQLLPVNAQPTGPVIVLVGALLLTLVAYLIIFLMMERVANWPVVIVLSIAVVTALLMAERALMAYFWLSFVLLGMIAFRFTLKYQEAKSKTSLLLALAFVALFVGSILNLLTPTSSNYYLAGSVARIVGYLMLVGSMVTIYSVGESPRSRATYRMRDMS